MPDGGVDMEGAGGNGGGWREAGGVWWMERILHSPPPYISTVLGALQN